MCFQQKSFHETSDSVLVWNIKTHIDTSKKHVKQTKHFFHWRFKPSTIPVQMCSHGGIQGGLEEILNNDWAQNVIHLWKSKDFKWEG